MKDYHLQFYTLAQFTESLWSKSYSHFFYYLILYAMEKILYRWRIIFVKAGVVYVIDADYHMVINRMDTVQQAKQLVDSILED